MQKLKISTQAIHIALALIVLISLFSLIGCPVKSGGNGDQLHNITGAIYYAPINILMGATGETTPVFSGEKDTNQTVLYSITPTLPSGITLDENTGKITVASTATAVESVYTVTAKGQGAYTGSITVEVDIRIANASATPITGTATFSTIIHEQGTSYTYAAPTWAGAISGQTVKYRISAIPGITINQSTGAITITDLAEEESGTLHTISIVGTGSYRGLLSSSVTITIIKITEPKAISYNGTNSTETAGATLGPFIKEPTTGAIFADSNILTIVGLAASTSYAVTIGDVTSNITSDNTGRLEILRSKIQSTNATDGANLTLLGGTYSTAENFATFKKTEIRDWKDLQAMRLDLAENYTLEKDIAFPASGVDLFPSAGFIPIGNSTAAFTGTFDGKNKKITKLFINNATLATGTGLFGVIEGASATTVMVKDIILANPNIVGKHWVGGVAGIVKKGIISNVRILGTSSDKIEARGTSATNLCGVTGSIVGGIVGGVCGGGTQNDVKIVKSANSGVPIIGANKYIGGLVGFLDNSRLVGYSTGNITTTATERIGGLVGGTQNYIDVVGYSTGNIVHTGLGGGNKVKLVGGLIGGHTNVSGNSRLIGYYSGEIKGGADYKETGGLIGVIGGALGTGAKFKIHGYFTGLIDFVSDKGGGILGSNHINGNFLLLEVYERGTIAVPTNNIEVGRISSSGAGLGHFGMFYSRVDSTYIFSGTSLTKANGASSGGTTFTTIKNNSTINFSAQYGVEINNITTANQSSFELGSTTRFDFGTTEGQWTYTTGKWPALNLGSEMPDSTASTQPIDP